jgi:SHS2 domain-containing protein
LAGGFQRIDHTADEGIHAWGKNGKEMFEEAAKGMFSILVDTTTVTCVEKRQLEIRALTVDELLLLWLKEILFLCYTENMVFSKFQIEKDNLSKGNAEAYFINAYVVGEKLNTSRHGICKEIKSITRHGFYIKKGTPWWEANILFDV